MGFAMGLLVINAAGGKNAHLMSLRTTIRPLGLYSQGLRVRCLDRLNGFDTE